MKKFRIPRKWKKRLPLIIAIVIGAVIGVVCAIYDAYGELLWTIGALYLSFFLQLILHEGGHLIGGLLSGYRFESFRIGGVLLTRIEGKMRVKWMPIAGTGGQCLLLPPDCEPQEAKYLIYHAAGSAMNFISAVCHIPLLFVPGIVRIYAGCMIVVGLYFGILNGVPLRVQGVDNDGMHIKNMRRDETLRKVIFRQLQINAAMSAGTRLRDMPEAWFETYQHAHLHGAMQFCRYIDQEAYDEALSYGQMLLRDKRLNRIHRGAVMSDVESLKLLAGQKVFAESAFLQQYRRQMAYDPAVQRAKYVRALLHDKDEELAEKILIQFERACRRSPSPVSNASEEAFIAAARAKYDEIKQTEGA